MQADAMTRVDPTALTLAHIETMRAAQEARSLELAYEMQLAEALRVSAAQAQQASHAPSVGSQQAGRAQHDQSAETSCDDLSTYLHCLSAQEQVFAEGISVNVDERVSAAMARNSKNNLARSLNDAKLAKMIQEMPDEEWEDKGDWVELPFEEGTQPPQVTLYFSGTCDSDGSGGGMGAKLLSPAGDILWQSWAHLEGLTAGVLEAKHRALLLGLEACASLGISDVFVPVDSDSVFRSVCGDTAGEALEGGEVIAQLRGEVERAKAVVGNARLVKVSRRSNRHAENLARKGYARGKVVHLEGPKIVADPAAQRGEGGAARAAVGANLKRDLEGAQIVIIEDTNTHKRFAGMDTGVTCPICLEDNKHRHEVLTLAACRHTFCLTCLEQHTLQYVSQRKYPVNCAEHGCKQTLEFDECEQALLQGGNTMEATGSVNMLGRLQVESMIPESQKFYCPYPTCSALSMLPQDGSVDAQAVCNLCKRHCCVRCKAPWHTGLTCEQFQRQPQAEDRQLLEMADRSRWRRCGGDAAGQGCGAMIELTTGCNHITCKCGYEFCYVCGMKWTAGKANCQCPLWDEVNLMDERERRRADRQDRRMQDPRYKTRLCRYFQSHNMCRFGQACTFAHGVEELDLP